MWHFLSLFSEIHPRYAYVSTWFLSMGRCYFTMCTFHSSFTHWLADGQLGCFNLAAIANKAFLDKCLLEDLFSIIRG